MRSSCNDHEMSLASAISQTRAGRRRPMRCPSSPCLEEDAMSESTYESALSRRRLLLGAGAVVASAGISPWVAETAAAAGTKVGGTLDFMSWQGYDSPKSLGPWLKANGVKFKPTYI